MNRIEQLFRQKRQDLLTIYFTAGYPSLTDTTGIIEALDRSGVDMIEIGIPFSDPMADGVTIQESNARALDNGMSIALLLEQLKNIRAITEKPLLLMGYFNPIFRYGVQRFCADAQHCGIDGLIIPDLPLIEFQRHYQELFGQHGLSCCFLVTTGTSKQRIREIDALPGGFIYLVTGPGVTGGQHNNYPGNDGGARIAHMSLQKPVLAGFGISSKEGYAAACRSFSGAIIGSSFIRALGSSQQLLPGNIETFIQSIRS